MRCVFVNAYLRKPTSVGISTAGFHGQFRLCNRLRILRGGWGSPTIVFRQRNRDSNHSDVVEFNVRFWEDGTNTFWWTER